MSDIKIYDNVIEAIRSQNRSHVLINCLDHDGFAVRHQNFQAMKMPDGTIGFIDGFSMTFYRGERKEHHSCVASLYRIREQNDRIVALLKSYDFQLFLETTDEVI